MKIKTVLNFPEKISSPSNGPLACLYCLQNVPGNSVILPGSSG
jgi:hypothetical protein